MKQENKQMFKRMKEINMVTLPFNSGDWLSFKVGLKESVFLHTGFGDRKTITNYLETLEYSYKRLYGIKLYWFYYRVKDGTHKVRHAIIISRKKIPKDIMKWFLKDHYKTGLFLGYPMCCIKKFIEEYKGDDGKTFSYHSSKRYIQQVKDMKMRDVFDIKRVGEIGNCGFVPCSPKCKKALDFKQSLDIKLDELDKIRCCCKK